MERVATDSSLQNACEAEVTAHSSSVSSEECENMKCNNNSNSSSSSSSNVQNTKKVSNKRHKKPQSTVQPVANQECNAATTAVEEESEQESLTSTSTSTSISITTSNSVSDSYINEDARRTSYEEVNELFDKVLNALGQLKELEQRNRLIAERELINLRAAYKFAVEEEKTVLAEIHKCPERLCKLSKSNFKPYQKAKVANRLLSSLEEYVKHKPAAKSFEHVISEVSLNNSSNENNTVIGRSTENKSDESAYNGNTSTMYSHCNKGIMNNNNNNNNSINNSKRSFISWKSVFHTPSERRMQSLVISIFMFFTAIPISLCITLLLLCCNKYTAVGMWAYLIYLALWGRTLHHPFHKNMWVARWCIWRYYTDYFPVRLVIPRYVRRQFDCQRNYFFVYHPHGIHTFGAMNCFTIDSTEISKMLPGITTHLQTLKANFYIPFWRTLLIMLGCGDTSASCIRATLRAGPGESVVVIVGGVEEALISRPYSNDIVLQKRKGFIRIALQEGSPLVPVYGFGENNVYMVPDAAKTTLVQKYYTITKKWLGFVVPLFSGRGFFNFNFGIMPHRQPIVVVVGEPIEVPKIANPTKEDLDMWHEVYVRQLCKLYNKHCGIYDLESTGLRIMR